MNHYYLFVFGSKSDLAYHSTREAVLSSFDEALKFAKTFVELFPDFEVVSIIRLS